MLYLSAYLSIHPSTCLDAYYIVFSTESFNIPIGSMYGIFTYICHKNQQKKGGKYTNCPWIPMGSGMSTSQKNRRIYRSHWQLGIPANSFDGIHLHRIPIIFVIRILGNGEVVVQHHTYPEWLPVKPWKEHAILFQTFHFLEGSPFWVFLCWDTPSNSHQASYAKQISQLSYF